MKAHIPDINPVGDDCVAFFDLFRDRHLPPELPSFLYAESLSDAISLLITLCLISVFSGLLLASITLDFLKITRTL
nr:caffeoylshikimate esterase-like [Ipomoea batatas]